jgi:hypothetical protein
MPPDTGTPAGAELPGNRRFFRLPYDSVLLLAIAGLAGIAPGCCCHWPDEAEGPPIIMPFPLTGRAELGAVPGAEPVIVALFGLLSIIVPGAGAAPYDQLPGAPAGTAPG